ncbi:site-specific integrase [Xanthomonas campestris]|uniref:site-specific integrase n=1 Tax=Xanthomonas campestris TaxID=339 RepID=UPI002AD313B1|nr:site-specific integrase [Xanthomonas campestris]MEA0681714.1 site-specific integrase [Xanthomonas campestris pv. campestris]MEA0814381.1 site-specific integrase [Xanthomonas campestris pv. campestris]MEB1326743.1 site-specific integrase [Xanthomonas campestris pv. campestris]MEB1540467.1 site-specific integrase [Xanthomonas campestris pv. campestris]MEB2197555.1 site-specific integrase [Xanthomonas campestris pv. campestris]
MRIPHHLSRSSTGRWSFVQRVPIDLQTVMGCRLIKRTLQTKDLAQAHVRAVVLGAGYARLFAQLKDQRVDKLSKTDADLLIARLTSAENLQELTLNRTRQPDGTVTEQWQIDSPKDLKLYRQLMELEAMAGAALQARAVPVAAPTMFGSPHAGPSRQASAPAIETMTLGKARDAFLATLKGSTLPKTYTIKKTAIEALVSFLGEKAKVHAITRSDLARWYQEMREKGASTPTLTNKQSYIGGKGGFFEWAMASGHYPKGDNPASGHVSYSQREKRARKKLGFKAYDRAQIQALFAPEALAKLSESARWASLIGLYTGARASEVGQLLVKDVLEEEGIPCIRISDEGEHQKVKTEVSLRTVPLHPELLAMGFQDWVDGKRKAGQTRLFPAAKATAVNGQGNWITKAFSRHLAEVGKGWEPAKRGFHSLRKTFIQELQGVGVVSELRAQIVGHELDDEHHSTYSRDFTVREKLQGIGAHSPGLSAIAGLWVWQETHDVSLELQAKSPCGG